MRKLWVLAFYLAAMWPAAAQLPSGSVAPDFSAKDLNGQTWRLYDLLDQGKIVILEISATWCAPCWAYHNGHAMQTFYEQHGPDGDDRARVLFIEGDPKTNESCLLGAAGCNNFTPGNWVAGTPFPIINDDSIAFAYKIEYFPTIFVVCPNRKLYEVGQWNAADLWEQALTCPVAAGADNAGIFDFSTGTPLREVCENLEVNPSFTLINLGSEVLNQATLGLEWNNSAIQTINWDGNLNTYGETMISFDPVSLSDAGKLTAKLYSVNNKPYDDDLANNIREDSFHVARNFNTLKVLLRIRTDQYGAETYWELRDGQGKVLETGGNKDVGPNGGGMFTGIAGGPGAYNDNALIRDTLDLPEPGCYSIHVVDYYGDGMCCEYGNGYYRLYNLNDPQTPILTGGDFRDYDDRMFSAGLSTAANEVDQKPVSLYLFPNPANRFIQADFVLTESAAISIELVNALGQRLQGLPSETLAPGEHSKQIEVGQLPEGMYWLRLGANGRSVAQKFVVQR